MLFVKKILDPVIPHQPFEGLFVVIQFSHAGK